VNRSNPWACRHPWTDAGTAAISLQVINLSGIAGFGVDALSWQP
jgi:hypothetical protein